MSNVMPESMFRHDDSLPLRIAKIIQPAAYAEVGEKGFSAFKAWKKERQRWAEQSSHWRIRCLTRRRRSCRGTTRWWIDWPQSA